MHDIDAEPAYEQTRLWRQTLACQLEPDSYAVQRQRLRDAFRSARLRARDLAEKIGRDLPDLTVHDITHIDALWQMADLIVGPDFTITPTEAFVLGASFLVHDLGLSLAAYVDGVKEIRRKPLWQDVATGAMRKRLGRHPTPAELKNLPKEVDRDVLNVVLRNLHAEQAEKLALLALSTDDSTNKSYLIDNDELRETFGTIIGRIAYSHWWSADRISELPRKIGAPTWAPDSWTLNPIVLACLLRTADAAHLDDRRAPGALLKERSLRPKSELHWIFQHRLVTPTREDDWLIYTSKSPFTPLEADAWWLCYDSLKTADRELHDADAILFANHQGRRFKAKGVTGIESPIHLAKRIEVGDWIPVDAQIKVSDVPHLIKTLGGEQLYGPNNLAVPLRELIQNASDAVRARRILEERGDAWGTVTVRHGTDQNGIWIEVDDCGVGMSMPVLTGPFLDFCTSFWKSDLIYSELPGLQGRGFQSTGNFGIGFFSVFMWGSRVQVITRPYRRGYADTHVLEFADNVSHRPLVRKAEANEQRQDGGTSVRVWLRPGLTLENIYRAASVRNITLRELCPWICPSLDVDVWVEVSGEPATRVLEASDWLTMPGRALLERITLLSHRPEDARLRKSLDTIGNNLEVIMDCGCNPIGRIAILTHSGFNQVHHSRHPGVVTIGGLRSVAMREIAGVLVGVAERAARDRAKPSIDLPALAKWATRQTVLVENACIQDELEASQIAGRIIMCGGDTGKLPIARSASRWLSFEHVAEVSGGDEVLLIQDDEQLRIQLSNHEVTLNDNVLVVPWTFPMVGTNLSWPPLMKTFGENPTLAKGTFVAAAIYAVAKSWGIAPDIAGRILVLKSPWSFSKINIGSTSAGKQVVRDAILLKKPMESGKGIG